jgi:hypothetical protein
MLEIAQHTTKSNAPHVSLNLLSISEAQTRQQRVERIT